LVQKGLAPAIALTVLANALQGEQGE